MLRIKDNLFIKSKIKCITRCYNILLNCSYLKVIFTDGSAQNVKDATIDDVIDLDREGDKY